MDGNSITPIQQFNTRKEEKKEPGSFMTGFANGLGKTFANRLSLDKIPNAIKKVTDTLSEQEEKRNDFIEKKKREFAKTIKVPKAQEDANVTKTKDIVNSFNANAAMNDARATGIEHKDPSEVGLDKLKVAELQYGNKIPRKIEDPTKLDFDTAKQSPLFRGFIKGMKK